MEDRLYQMMSDLGGMDIPMNAPRGNSQNKRLRPKDGDTSADFPGDFVLDEAVRKKKQVIVSGPEFVLGCRWVDQRPN